MNRKAVSPVVATMLLVAVAVSSVSAYWVWVRSFQTQIQKEVEQQAGVSGNLRLDIVSLTDDGTSYYVTLKNASSSGTLEFRTTQDFIIDGQNNWDSIQPSLPRSVNAGSNVTFVLKRSTNHSTGTQHSFVFIGHTSRDQVVATISYRDS
jgi:flagellin-like protein